MVEITESFLIHGGSVVNRGGVVAADVLVEGGRVARVGADLTASLPTEAEGGPKRISAHGCLVASSFVDLHTHMREPGREESETIATASRSATLGGYGACVAMPKPSCRRPAPRIPRTTCWNHSSCAPLMSTRRRFRKSMSPW